MLVGQRGLGRLAEPARQAVPPPLQAGAIGLAVLAQKEARRGGETQEVLVDGAVLAEQAVAALAVGVVGDQVEGADALEALVMLGALAQREVVLLEVGGDEALQRALAVRSLLAAHRERHHVPAEGLREVPGGQLAAEEAGRKVPEWPLAAAGLVDGERAGVVEPRLDQERGVAAPRQPALHGEVAAQEHLADARGRHHSLATTWPLARGQTWPA